MTKLYNGLDVSSYSERERGAWSRFSLKGKYPIDHTLKLAV